MIKMKKYLFLLIILFISGCGAYDFTKSMILLQNIDNKYNLSSIDNEEKLNNLLDEYSAVKVDLIGKKNSQFVVDMIEIKELFIKSYYESQQYYSLINNVDICSHKSQFDEANAHLEKTISYWTEARAKIEAFEKNYPDIISKNQILKDNFQTMKEAVSQENIDQLKAQMEEGKKNFDLYCQIQSAQQ